MKRPEFIARQARHPKGFLGAVLSSIMGFETAAENCFALKTLEIQPTDHVLEIGFGQGRAIHKAAKAAFQGFVAGVDPSEQMVRIASRNNRRVIADGRVELKVASSGRLPYPNQRFDKAFSVHTVYFWTNPAEDLREIARVLRPDARFVLGFRPKDARAKEEFPTSVYTLYAAEEVQSLLENCGFQHIQIIDAGSSHRPFSCAVSSNRP